MNYAITAIALLAFSANAAVSRNVVVTAEGSHGAVPSEITADNVSVEVNHRPARVEDWTPLRGDHAALELYIVIDDGENSNLGTQFTSLKEFINEQPATTKIGLAYLRNGAANIVVPLTTAHEKVAAALRLPIAEPGVSASPYMGISDLVKKWSATDARREVLLISSGIDPWSPADPENPYLLQSIADAQRAGVLVHSIYYAEAGRLGRNSWLLGWGQNYLAELSEETGGEAYWQGSRSPVSFDPYLKDLSQRLQNQYRVTLAPDGTNREAQRGLAPVHVAASGPRVSIETASKIAM